MLGALGGALIGKAASWLGGRVFGSAGRAAVQGGAAAAGGAVVGSILTRTAGQNGPPIGGPPTGSFLPTTMPTRSGTFAPQPVEGVVGRTVSKLLPGGMTGYEYAPLAGTEYDKWGRPIAVGPVVVQRYKAPTGYVIVKNDQGEAIALLKGPARAMGLWHPRKKPLISIRDSSAIQRAHSAKKRIAKIAKKAAKC